MSKKKGTKLAAVIALIAILGSIVGTGVLVIFEAFTSQTQPQQEQKLSQQQLDELFKTLTGTNISTGTQVSSGDSMNASGSTILTGMTK